MSSCGDAAQAQLYRFLYEGLPAFLAGPGLDVMLRAAGLDLARPLSPPVAEVGEGMGFETNANLACTAVHLRAAALQLPPPSSRVVIRYCPSVIRYNQVGRRFESLTVGTPSKVEIMQWGSDRGNSKQDGQASRLGGSELCVNNFAQAPSHTLDLVSLHLPRDADPSSVLWIHFWFDLSQSRDASLLARIQNEGGVLIADVPASCFASP